MEKDGWGHPIIRVATWQEVNALVPVEGTRVIVNNGEGDFIWHKMWNPFVGKHQIVRG